ncbi:MAG: carboxypeptidase-like regulatory domain-containing protein, partial [Minisyncoccia bacterium]
TYPTLSVHAALGTIDTAATPSINSWSVSYERGPVPLPNLVFGLQGLKTIGSGPSGFLFKYSTTTLSTGVTAGVNVANLEWDTYTISVNGAVTGYDIASSCAPQPEALPPGAYLSTTLIMAPHTTHSFLVDVRSSAGVSIPNASVRLYRGAYDSTLSSDGCGNAFFSSLAQGTPGGGNPYALDVSASGFQSFTTSEISVSGTSKLSVVLNAL